MLTRRHGSCARAGLAGILLATALPVASSCAGGAGEGADAGSPTSTLELGDAGTPCDRYFAAKYGFAQASRFGCGPALPAAEVVRTRARFDRSCEDQMALPGSGVTVDKLEACVSTWGLTIDSWAQPTTCVFRGSLAGGAPCVDEVQCQSGACEAIARSPVAPTCGKCVPALAVDQPCNRSSTCPEGSGCFALAPDAAYPDYTCLPIAIGDAGAHCDDLSSVCAPGLYCDPDASKCSPPAKVGETCGRRPCAPPLSCSAFAGVCRPRAPAGAACGEDCDCGPGLGCFSQRCAAATWVAPGGTCSFSDALCLVGNCAFGDFVNGPPPPPSLDGGPLLGACPRVIADGEPCDAGDARTTCDTFSQCFEGRCALIDSVLCRP